MIIPNIWENATNVPNNQPLHHSPGFTPVYFLNPHFSWVKSPFSMTLSPIFSHRWRGDDAVPHLCSTCTVTCPMTSTTAPVLLVVVPLAGQLIEKYGYIWGFPQIKVSKNGWFLLVSHWNPIVRNGWWLGVPLWRNGNQRIGFSSKACSISSRKWCFLMANLGSKSPVKREFCTSICCYLFTRRIVNCLFHPSVHLDIAPA